MNTQHQQHTWTRRVFAAAGLVCVAVASVAVAPQSGAATSDSASATAAAPGGGRPSGRLSFTNLEEAVRAGVVDGSLAQRLREGETVGAILTVDQGPAIFAAESAAQGLKGRLRAAEVGRRLADAYAASKASVKAAAQVKVRQDYGNLPSVLIEISSADELLALANQQQVTSITPDAELVHGSMDPESATLVRQPTAAASGYRGAGTYVGVLDTGIDITRPDFGSCTANGTPATCRAWSYEIATNDGVYDDNGHGTNVSGIVAGMAPAAGIIGLDVFTGGSAYTSSMLAGMNQLIDWKRAGTNIVAANLSIWTKGSVYAGYCPDNLGFGTARSVGILPVVIAGNGGSTAGVSYPGCISGALTVGAVYDRNYDGRTFTWTDGGCADSNPRIDQVTCFSQSGPTLQMLAPGAEITAAGITQSGTSQAAPHVAGAAAVLAAAKPSATVTQIQSALVSNGRAIVDRDGRTRRRLDLVSSLNGLIGSSDATKPVATAPKASAVPGSTFGSTQAYRIFWSATDNVGVTGYELWVSTNGGSFAQVTLSSPTTTTVDLSLTPGTLYRFVVRARDGAGNWSNDVYGAAFRVVNHTELSSAIGYSAGWTRTAWASAAGGYFKVSANASATASFTFTGSSVSWVGTMASNRGRARLYVDGVDKGTFDLYSSTTRARVNLYAFYWSSSGTHTVKVVVEGTSGRPTVDIDSFLVTS